MTFRMLAAAALVALAAAGCSNQAPTAVDSNALLSRDQVSDARHRVPDEHLQRNFRTHLKGRNEVPPVKSRGQGQAVFQVRNDPPELHFKLMVSNLRDVVGAHIHMAPAGANGPVVVDLLGGNTPDPGRVKGVLVEGVITPADLVGPLENMPLRDLLRAMSRGNAYVNVHTLAHMPGEIRGQIH